MKIDVKTSTNNYEVIIERDILNKANKYLDLSKKVLIVSDSGVPSIYIDTLKKQCVDPYVFIFKCGEESKNAKAQDRLSHQIKHRQTPIPR